MNSRFSGASRHSRLLVGALLGLSCAIVLPARAEDIVFPADANVINAKAAPYNAKGDGINDDTAELQAAVTDAIQTNKILYLPNGTYIVSDTLKGINPAGEWDDTMILQGQSRAQTIIKLKDSVFTDVAAPKAVVQTASQNSTDSIGSGAQTFKNALYNLTVDTGSGNVGARGVDFLATNKGCMRNVTVKSSDATKRGVAGISMRRYGPGPCLLKNVGVDGFDIGMDVKNFEYSVTCERLTLTNQKLVGLRNQDNMVSIRDLQSTNTVPVIQLKGKFSMVVLVGGDFSGGASPYAIENGEGSQLYVRGLTTSGYGAAVQGRSGTKVEGDYATQVWELFPSARTALNLPVEETSEYADPNLANWRSVTFHGAVPSDGLDDTAAIQAALNSGKSTIYFPKGIYNISDTLTVGGNVRRIMGMESQITKHSSSQFGSASNPRPVFLFQNSVSVVLERLNYDFNWDASAPGAVGVEHSGSGSLHLKDISIGAGTYAYRPRAGAGSLFIENLTTRRAFLFDQAQNVWARQFNVEGEFSPMVQNSAANVWILGFKTEREFTTLKTTGGQTEILGGLLYPTRSASVPAFDIRGGRVSISAVGSGNTGYSTVVSETSGGSSATLLRSQLEERGSAGWLLPLYVSGTVGNFDSVKINFQPLSAAVPTGYLKDTGSAFAGRAGVYSYGWLNGTSPATNFNAADRNSSLSPDQRYDTLNSMQRNGTFTWELAVPNGSYRVHVVAGDAIALDSVYKINVEGVLTVNGIPSTSGAWVEGTTTVTVSDGRLTISNATGASNNKICFVDIEGL